MSKMTVIQLLNKIANGEVEENKEYLFYGSDYCTIREFFNRYIVDKENLNLKVETLGEDKKIEEIKMDFDEFYKHYNIATTINGEEYYSIIHSATDKIFCGKINEIIDYINKEDK